MVAWALAADADFDPRCMSLADYVTDHRGDRLVPFVEQPCQILRVPVNAQNELCQVILEPIENPSNRRANFSARITLDGISHIM